MIMATQSTVLIQPGLKIKCHNNFGTLGFLACKYKVVSRESKNNRMRTLKVADRSKVYLVSCYHVLDNDEHPAGKVVLPDYNDLEIATYSRDSTTANKEYDIAIAQIKPEFVSALRISNTVVDTNETIKDVAFETLILELECSVILAAT